MKTVSVTDVLRNFADYINRVAYRGERFTLIRGGRPVAELTPVPGGTRAAELPALLERLPRLGDEDAEQFRRDVEEARDGLGNASADDPWGS
jgi:antitoxin (DNA-binding transcriptional repressor) of toxin-antitoxin stability system